MGRYREKPIPIEANQFWPDKKPWPKGTEERLGLEVDRYHGDPDDVVAIVKTPKGWYIVKPGDWVIKNAKGETYPCKSGIFEATYEIVEDE